MNRKIIIRLNPPDIWPVERPILIMRLKSFKSDMICEPDLSSLEPAEIIEAVQSGLQFLLDAENVASVVRCKDCKWWEKGKNYTPYCNHPVTGLFDLVYENSFCSYGERKDGETK